MVEVSELRSFPLFADLPDDQITWFIDNAEELALKPGDIYSHQGQPAEFMFVILEGQLEARGEFAGESVTFASKPGDATGLVPFSRMKQSPVTGRAVTKSRILRFPA